GRQVIRCATGDETLVDNDLLVNPFGTCVAQIGSETRVARESASVEDIGVGENPRAVADHAYGLVLLEECAREIDRCLVEAEVIRVHDAAWEHERIEIIG